MHNFVNRCISAAVLLGVLIAGAPLNVAHASSVCYVDAGAAGTNDGSSWTNAYTGLQTALGLCPEIWVSAGVYKPGVTRAASLSIPQGVKVYGGFYGTETARSQRNPSANITILSGDIDNNDPNSDGNEIDENWNDVVGLNSFHVVTIDGTLEAVTAATVLDGFTITGGQGSNDEPGAGLYCEAAGSGGECSPSLSNLVFSGNTTNDNGGGLMNDASNGGVSSPELTNVSFTGNNAYEGGALMNDGSNGGTSSPTLINVTFEGNDAAWGGALMNLGEGGGVSSPVLNGVVFNSNHAYYGGGAMYDGGYQGTSSPTLNDVTFSDNSCDENGGAVYNDGSHGTSSPVLTNVTFSGNSTVTDGGALFNFGFAGSSDPSLTDVAFHANTASNNGGAIYNEGEQAGHSSPVLTNVVLSGNHADNFGGAIYNDGNGGHSSPTLTNVTFSGNTATRGGAVFSDGGVGGSSNPQYTNVTFSGNNASNQGGALYNTAVFGASHLMLTNVILWGDTAPTGPEILNGTVTTEISHSVVQGAINPKTGIWDTSFGFDAGGNRSWDPALGPLQNNGGFTETMALGPGSSALDGGEDTACAATPMNNLDQRGMTRPVDGNFDGPATCDIGAYEWHGHLFADVPVTGKEWMEPYVDAFHFAGITTGCGASPLIYCPENAVTRAAMAVFCLRAKHGSSYVPPAATHTFCGYAGRRQGVDGALGGPALRRRHHFRLRRRADDSARRARSRARPWPSSC